MSIFFGPTSSYLLNSPNITGTILEKYRVWEGSRNGFSPTLTPTLDLNFAGNKSLIDDISGQNLITFTRSSSATYVDSDGLIKTATSNIPRFEHNPLTGVCNGLLLEESRTNQLSNSMPTTSSAQITNTLVTGLPGVFSTGRRLTTSGGTDVRIQLGTNTLNVVFAYSFWARLGTQGSSVFLRNGTGAFASWNLSTATVTRDDFGTSGIINYGNGWYRCYSIITGTGSSGFLFGVGDQGMNSSNGDNIIIAGVQIEPGSYPTSYIETSGSTVTRNADVMSITGTNFSRWYNNNEGTFFTDATLAFTQNAGNPFTFGGVFYTAVDGSVRTLANTPTIMGGLSNSLTTFSKTAVALKSGDFAVGRGGSITGNGTTVYTPTGTEVRINSSLGSTALIRRLAYWNVRIPNTNLQLMTR